jgi:uncharacterized protein (TIGR02246 family)
MGGPPDPGELVVALAAALNGKDPVALSELFDDDAVFVNVRGSVMRGRTGVASGHSVAFRGPLAGSTFQFDVVEVRPVRDDVVVVLAHCHRGRLPDAPPTTGPAIETLLQLVASRGGEGWQIVAAANVPVTG